MAERSPMLSGSGTLSGPEWRECVMLRSCGMPSQNSGMESQQIGKLFKKRWPRRSTTGRLALRRANFRRFREPGGNNQSSRRTGFSTCPGLRKNLGPGLTSDAGWDRSPDSGAASTDRFNSACRSLPNQSKGRGGSSSSSSRRSHSRRISRRP